jgi:hypothetical protein
LAVRSTDTFLRSVTLLRDRVESFDAYPFSIPAVRHLKTLEFHPKVTFFVGENGTGKSTLIEGIAVAAGFNPEGGTANFKFATRASHSGRGRALTPAPARAPRGHRQARPPRRLPAHHRHALADHPGLPDGVDLLAHRRGPADGDVRGDGALHADPDFLLHRERYMRRLFEE